ncbi:conserved Plasmodium protein, unknown function [Plasmodium ovale curtisi]|uniref:G-patch domain-containing protein n=1 Tax=Plasmodium ovale curtisi TaxID=864141 RepID=A0A1A8WEK9_PLAOA|nr:conserved Plasmodium protein, unknown function [Plasmodium ovale curtisi]SBS90485.1 conserved Plasmodium protein, unknown function [Plasmodium ovale curtisi]
MYHHRAENQSKPVESKFGSYILQKFGWEKGKGLGKYENGDVNIMKIKKYGEYGLGYNEKQEKNLEGMWWEDMYNQCAKKISQSSKKDYPGGSPKNVENDLSASNEKQLAETDKVKGKKVKKKETDSNIKYSIFVKKGSCVRNTSCQKPSTSESHDEKDIQRTNNEKGKVRVKKKKICKKDFNGHIKNADDDVDQRKATEGQTCSWGNTENGTAKKRKKKKKKGKKKSNDSRQDEKNL